jgi:hypothetical protein
MNETARVHHNRQRMAILRALKLHLETLSLGIGDWLDFDELREVLDKMDLPMVTGQLAFHVSVCEAHGWLDLKRGRTERSVNAILKVRLTAAGLDRIDIGKMPDLEDTQKFPARNAE